MFDLQQLEVILQGSIIKVIENFYNHWGLDAYPTEFLESISKQAASTIINQLMNGE